jgi:2-polyprenyl-6-methoxyphenol hydroxylase-like FAD-dependent oxidoreductase
MSTSTAPAARAGSPLDPSRPALVLGTGPVGQTAALLLAEWGVPTVMVDSRPERDPIGSKALCQQRDVLDVWDHVGAGRQIADEGVTWRRAVTLYHGEELFTQGFVDRGHSPFPPFVNIGQDRTEAILDTKIDTNPLIDVRWGHHVIGIEQDDEQVTLVCLAGPADTPREVRISGAYLVVCAGAKSDEVRAMLGLTFDGQTFTDQFLICDIRTEMPGWEQERRFYFDPPWNPGRQVLIHPCPNSTFRIDWQVPPEYDLAAEEASGALEARIRKIIGDADYEIVWKSVYRFHARQVDRMRVGRVLVAGDAAHLVSPFGARGLNSGVPDAENAAWKIAFVMHGWADETLLDSYHQERHAAAVENLTVTAATMDFLVPQSEQEWTRRREILEAAATDPQARAQVNSGRLAEPFWYVDSPLTTPSDAHQFEGRPEKGHDPVPAPGVLAPDVEVDLPGGGGRVRIRSLARRGLLVLAGAGMDATAVADSLSDLRCPVRVISLADADPDGEVTTALNAKPDEAWVLRPDAHIAAVVTDPAEVGAAARRAVGAA